MHLKMLGTAAGGGVPQWNCSCPLCALARFKPERVVPRLQLQAIVSRDGDQWYLLNASPDLRLQIECNPELHPRASDGARNSPIAGVILTSADLDQVLGLVLLREFQPLTVYATALVRKVLEANSFFRMLQRVPNQLTWIVIQPGTKFEVGQTGLWCTPIALEGTLPLYARELDDGASGQAELGLVLEANGRRVAYTPALPHITAELLQVFTSCDAILVDGTFWSDAELSETHAGTPMARAIGHVPLSGADGTLALLSDLQVASKTLVHINNTNPILDSESPEHAAVIKAGWQIGFDGWQLT